MEDPTDKQVTVTGRCNMTFERWGRAMAYVAIGEGVDHHLVAVPVSALKLAETAEPERVADDGTVRKTHYGDGRQPWDDIVESGWAPHFASANVLKYLRRTKEVEDSVRKARWYYERLRAMDQGERGSDRVEASLVIARLVHLLTTDEWATLQQKENVP